MKKNIVLIGMPGSGKSTIGVLLAKAINYQFIDGDLLIQRQEKKTLVDIINEKGIDAFLAIENQVLREINTEASVIATGGSAILMYAMLFRVLVGLYSCIYVAQKNAKKIAYTSISAAIINITVNLILINKIKIFAASISTLVAFFSMFIIRYIDVNKTVHMRIRKPIIIGSILIGTMLIGTYYCENKMIQLIALCITAIYAVLTNVDMLKSGMKLVKSRFGK